jgi:hypothetical protein
MSLFKDKKFEELDWLSQITETIESDINNMLSEMPDEVDVPLQNLMDVLRQSSDPKIGRDSLLKDTLRNLCREKQINLSYEDEAKIFSCYVFKTVDDPILDIENGTLSGKITLLKKVFAFDEDFLQKNMGKEGIGQLYWLKVSRSPSRAREIARLLNVDVSKEVLSSSRKLGRFIAIEVGNILRNNQWRIRNTELADKMCNWIVKYVESGCRASYSNFCRLKVMTHSGGPIYSIEEEI